MSDSLLFSFYWKPVEQVLRFLWFSFSKHKRFLLFKYHADHRLVYMLVIILFATADNAKVWSENCHVFAYVEKYPSFS